jgi:hypothetical protein
MVSSEMLRRVALVGSDVSEVLSTSIIRVTRIGELGTMLAVTSNQRMLRKNTKNVLPKRRLLQEPHGVTSQKTPFFIVTTVKISNLTCDLIIWGIMSCLKVFQKVDMLLSSSVRNESFLLRLVGNSPGYSLQTKMIKNIAFRTHDTRNTQFLNT